MSLKVPKKREETTSVLNARRIKLGLTLDDMAKQLNTTGQSVGNWMSGKYRPTDEMLCKLAKILKMDETELQAFYDSRKMGSRNVPGKRIEHKPPKETFWRDKRKESGLKLPEIAELIGLDRSYTTIGEYFTGQLMPSDEICRTICAAFDVDFALGKEHFERAHKEWVSWHHWAKPEEEMPAKLQSLTRIDIEDDDKSTGKITQELPEYADHSLDIIEASEEIKKSISEPEPQLRDIRDEICESVYSVLSYKDYCIVHDIVMSGNSNAGVLEQIYGKVDCNTFNRIYDLIGE